MTQTDPQARPGSGTSVVAALVRFPWSSLAIAGVVLALSGLVGAATAGGTGATASMALTSPSGTSLISPGSTSDAALSRYAAQRAAFAGSDAVLSAVAAQLPETTVAELRAQVTITSASGANTLLVTADAGSPERSVQVADAVVAAYQEQTRAQLAALTDAALAAIGSSLAEAQALLEQTPSGPAASSAATTLAGLQQEANSLKTDRAVFDDGVEFTEAAQAVTGSALPARELALGLVVGLGLAAVVAWLRADGDRRVEEGAQASATVGAPLLGVVVEDPDRAEGAVPVLADLPSPEYAPVTPAVALRAPEGVLLVTSSVRGEGRTTAALNIAVDAARQGSRVVLVDADLATAATTRLTGGDGDLPGVGDLVALPGQEWAPGLLQRRTVGPQRQLHVLPAGTAPADQVDVQLSRLRDLVDVLRRDHDLVVVDAGPLPAGSLPALLARLADHVLVVVRRGSAVAGVEHTAELLDLYGTPVAGVLMTFGRSARRHRALALPQALRR